MKYQYYIIEKQIKFSQNYNYLYFYLKYLIS